MNRKPTQPQRRAVLKQGVCGGLGIASLLALPKVGIGSDQDKDGQSQKVHQDEDSKPEQQHAETAGKKVISKDRQAVLAAGMTEAEADCWEQTAKAAGAFFKLPELHPTDNAEVANAIHIIQNKLLSRPTYRKYLEFHKSDRLKKN